MRWLPKWSWSTSPGMRTLEHGSPPQPVQPGIGEWSREIGISPEMIKMIATRKIITRIFMIMIITTTIIIKIWPARLRQGLSHSCSYLPGPFLRALAYCCSMAGDWDYMGIIIIFRIMMMIIMKIKTSSSSPPVVLMGARCVVVHLRLVSLGPAPWLWLWW